MWNNNKEYLQVQIYPCGYILKKFSQVDFSPFLTYLFIYLFGQHYSLSLIKKKSESKFSKSSKKNGSIYFFYFNFKNLSTQRKINSDQNTKTLSGF